MTITRGEFDRITRLAGLRIEEPESESMRDDLRRILEFVRSLDTLDNTGTDSRIIAAGGCPLRDDIPKQSLAHDDAVRNAPAETDGWFTVGTTIARDSQTGSP